MSLVGIVGHGTAWGRGREAPARARARARRQVFLHVGRNRRGAAVCLAALHWRSLCVSVSVCVCVCLSGFGFGCGLGLQVRVLTMRPPGIEVRSPAFPRGTSFWGRPQRRQVLCMGACVGHGGQWWHFAGRCGPVARQQCGIWWGCLWFFLGWQEGGGGAALRPWCVRRTCGRARASAQPRLTADLT